ncbi:MAG TPA: hypothetical protein DHV85_14195 [Candidatus Accumulibacter sp.]|nr:hypothetical protein [Accumulibacter sp.]
MPPASHPQAFARLGVLSLLMLGVGQAAAQASPDPTSPTSAAPASPVTARAGTLKAVQGEVIIVGQGNARRPATPGAAIYVRDRLLSGPQSGASVVLRDGTGITLGPSSQIDFTVFAFDSTTQRGSLLVHVLEGSIRVATGLLARFSPELFKVTTPTSVVGVRGTDFIVETPVKP